MTSLAQVLDTNNLETTFESREECLAVMRNISARMSVPHCQAEWDQFTEMCWGPTPAGVTALVTCPDDGYLNPNHFASRKCLSNATWYVNLTVDDKPYTNYDNCFLPEDPSAEDDLKKLVNKKIINILKSLDEYTRLYLILHVVSIALLVASIIICAVVVVKLRHKRPLAYSYIALAVAAVALLVNHAVSVSVSAVDDATNVHKCRIAKSLVLISAIIFYECIMVYFYMCLVPILQITLGKFLFKFLITTVVTLSILLVLAEEFAEIMSGPSRYCGFRTLQSKFHWLTTAPRLMLVMSNLCLDCVTMFGAFYLKQPHLEKRCELRHIHQKVICALIMVLFYIVLEILHVLMHTEAYLHYSNSPVNVYLHSYSFMIAIQGIVFTALMCFFDFEVLNMLGLPDKYKSVNSKSPAVEGHVQMYWHNDFDKNSTYDLDYRTQQEVDAASANARVELVFHTASPDNSTESKTKVYESRLIIGS